MRVAVVGQTPSSQNKVSDATQQTLVRGLYQASEGRVCRSEPPPERDRDFLSKTLPAQIRQAEEAHRCSVSKLPLCLH